MDPLSIFGCVLGILTVTGKLTGSLVDFIQREKDAPASMHGIVTELSALRACLSQLQPFMQGSRQASTTRTSQISVEQLVIINTSCVLTLSELDKMMDSFKLQRPFSLLDKMRWAKNEPKIRELLSRVRTSQSSLNLILAIFTCTTVNEIRIAVDGLATTVEDIRASSEDVSRRLAFLESNDAGADTSTMSKPSSLACAEASDVTTSNEIKYHVDSSGACHSEKNAAQHTAASYIDWGLHQRDSVDPNNGSEIDVDMDRIGTDLELLLQESRAYSQGISRETNISRPFSRTSTAGWSSISAISLSQVPNISVLSLPVSIHELWNSQNYQSNPNPPRAHARSGEINAVPHMVRKNTGIQRTGIGQRWLDALSDARRREGLPASRAKNSSITGYNVVTHTVSSVNYPQIKLVLAGNLASGKSTMLKQMRIAYAAHSITPRERENVREVLIDNTTSVLQASSLVASQPGPQYHPLLLYDGSGNVKLADRIDIPTLQREWIDELVEAAGSRTRDNPVNDTVGYYLRNQERLHSNNYAANDKDFLHAYVKTTGIHETYLVSRNMEYRVYDIGGHRAERKKWLHVLEDIDCLVFVVSLADYDTHPGADNSYDIRDSLTLLEGLLNTAKCLTTRTIVLLFNKVDIFREKIKQSPISDFWPDYSGPEGDYESAIRFFTEKFRAIQKPGDRREIYVYYSDATNMETSGIVLQSIEALMVSRNNKYHSKGYHSIIFSGNQSNTDPESLVRFHR